MVCLSISLNLPLSISVSQYLLDLSSYLILTEGSSLYLHISIPACTFRLPMPVAVGSKSGKEWWWPAVRILSPLYRKHFFFLLPFLCIAGFFFFFFLFVYIHRLSNIALKLWNNIIHRLVTYTCHFFKGSFFLTCQHLIKSFCFYILY